MRVACSALLAASADLTLTYKGYTVGCSSRIKQNSFSQLVTSAHPGVCVHSPCFTDNSNLLDAVIGVNNCCDLVAHTHTYLQHTALYRSSSRLRETSTPRRRAQLDVLSYSSKQSHRDGLHFPSAFL